jgi:hypothetical protein
MVGRKLGGELHSVEEFRVTQWFASSATAVSSSPETRRGSPHRRTTPSAVTMRIEPRRRKLPLRWRCRLLVVKAARNSVRGRVGRVAECHTRFQGVELSAYHMCARIHFHTYVDVTSVIYQKTMQ